MTNFIPVFPLNLVVFPGETLDLHIFEPRYRQLIRECMEQHKPFGIPPVVDRQHQHHHDLGTLVELIEVTQEHADGRLDIRVRGIKVFRILQDIPQIPDKLYSGAIVTYPDNIVEGRDSEVSQRIMREVKQLYALMKVRQQFPAGVTPLVSYEIAHQVGLSQEGEYELLGLFSELQRLEYIRRHLKRYLEELGIWN